MGVRNASSFHGYGCVCKRGAPRTDVVVLERVAEQERPDDDVVDRRGLARPAKVARNVRHFLCERVGCAQQGRRE